MCRGTAFGSRGFLCPARFRSARHGLPAGRAAAPLIIKKKKTKRNGGRHRRSAVRSDRKKKMRRVKMQRRYN